MRRTDRVEIDVHPGTIQLAGDTATGRAYVAEFGRLRDGRRFAERSYEIRYYDAMPLTGAAPGTAGSLDVSTPAADRPA